MAPGILIEGQENPHLDTKQSHPNRLPTRSKKHPIIRLDSNSSAGML